VGIGAALWPHCCLLFLLPRPPGRVAVAGSPSHQSSQRYSTWPGVRRSMI